jgi:hypothetical protein
MFVLGRLFYQDLPYLQDMGLWGAVILGIFLMFIFMGIGWVYDIKAKMWAPDIQATTERNPYAYVATYKELALNYPFLFSLLSALKELFQREGVKSRPLSDLCGFLDEYYRKGATKDGITSATELSSRLSERLSLDSSTSGDQAGIPLCSRAKLGFQVAKIRLNWIQNLTGLAQDTLVFGVFYITLFVPGASVGDNIPFATMILGILFISIPLFVGLAIAGWYYDKKLQVWSPERIIMVERDPYCYVPRPRFHAFDVPFLYPLLRLFRDFAASAGIDHSAVDRLISYLDEFSALHPKKKGHIRAALELRESYGNLFSSREHNR